jgi:serine phosphatase RsbU (regulator of sigma subunit)
MDWKMRGIFLLIFGILTFYESHAQDSFFQFSERDTVQISAEMFNSDDQIIYLQDRWRFHPGDDLQWAEPDYDDSQWSVISTNLSEPDLAFIDWEGIGWFRIEMKVDESLRAKPVALIVDRHLGASEIYINGEKVYELGSFSESPESVVSFRKEAPIPIVFDNSEIQVFAVRFINPDYSITGRVMGYNGFRFHIGDWEVHQSASYTYLSQNTAINMFYIGLLIAFSLFHILLFVFNRSEFRNLYFSIFVGMLALLSYLLFRAELSFNTIDSLIFFRFLIIAEVLVLAFAARFTHSIDKNRTPFYANLLILFAMIVVTISWFNPGRLFWLIELSIILFVIEILRTLIVLFYKNRGAVWLLGSGVLVFILTLVLRFLVNFDLISGSVQILNMAGSGFLVISMSIYLSREFAVTQRKLQLKLEEVRELSKKSIEQERLSKEREIERRLLEAENNRKTRELEEARSLQLSMLPQKMPQLKHFEIAVFMETATEVGGDYYDYSIGNNGELVIAMGDATGHGMKAGIMVASAKSYFHSLVHESDNLTMLKRMSAGIKNMNMRMMYMGLSIIQIDGNKVEMVSAGMPPILHFKQKDSSVQRITLKGLPLGTKVEFPYTSESIHLEEGDMIMLMSDGLIELFNTEREMLGIERVEELLRRSEGDSVNDLMNQLKQLIHRWVSGHHSEDDITVMLLKYRPE